MTTLNPYPAYTDFGVDWLGRVPEHWSVLKLERLNKINPLMRAPSMHRCCSRYRDGRSQRVLINDVVTGKLDVRGVELPTVEEVIGEEIEAAMEDEEHLEEEAKV